MNDGQAGVARAAGDRSERADGPGGWWQADDGFWYPPAAAPAAPGNRYDTGGPGSTMAALQAAASRWAATPDPAATGGAGTWASTPAERGAGPSAAGPGGGTWAAEPSGGPSAAEPGGGAWAAESGGRGAWGAEPGGGAWGDGQGPGGGDDSLTAPVTMAGNGGEGMSPPPLYASAEAPRAPGMAETFRSWPLWARVAAPMAAAFVALVLVGGAVAAVAGEPEESDGTETAATQPSTTAERTTTTTRPPTTTTAAPTTTAPPATTTTAPRPTTAPPAPAAPLPPPTTAAPPATVAPAPAEPACHPSYSGCVPMASDVDCAGGSGDGPEYTGMVTVIGTDEYDLDSDNDGVACEP